MSKYTKLVGIQRNEDKFIDLQTELFVKRINKVYNEAESRLIAMLEEYKRTNKLNVINFEFALANKTNIKNVLVDSGYYQEVTSLLNSEQNLIDLISKEFTLFNYDVKFSDTSRLAITELQKQSAIAFEGLGATSTNKLYDDIFRSLTTDVPFKNAVSAIKTSLAGTGLEKYAGTYANTGYMQFSRTVSNLLSDQAGWNRHQYVGPIDNKIRPFCMNIIGGIFAKEEIESMNNGQTSNVFTDGGGYNCRHKWIGVPNDYQLTNADQKGIIRQKDIVVEQRDLKKAA